MKAHIKREKESCEYVKIKLDRIDQKWKMNEWLSAVRESGGGEKRKNR